LFVGKKGGENDKAWRGQFEILIFSSGGTGEKRGRIGKNAYHHLFYHEEKKKEEGEKRGRGA